MNQFGWKKEILKINRDLKEAQRNNSILWWNLKKWKKVWKNQLYNKSTYNTRKHILYQTQMFLRCLKHEEETKTQSVFLK